MFPVGAAGRRELRRALVDSRYPEETIKEYQQSHSLNTMVARALGTTPRNATEANVDEAKETEPLDTDSVSTFLSHLGIPRHELHKRIADSLRSQLEDEIRKTKDDAPLLNLLKSCWPYATSTPLPELRQVLWAVLKHLGSRIPLTVLERLAERDEKTGKLKHAELWKPLPPLLKRLVWEADWDSCMSKETESDPEKFLAAVNKTLLGEMVLPLINDYCSDDNLVAAADKAFVGSTRERRVATQQRRSPGGSSTTATATTMKPLQLSKSNTAEVQSSSTDPTGPGQALSSLRRILGGTGDADGAASTYRPKLLCAVLNILIMMQGKSEVRLLGGSSQLHCTLVTDLLISAGGPLPKAYQYLLAMARVLDDKVNAGELTDSTIAATQSHFRNIVQTDESVESDAVGSPSRLSKEKKAKGAQQGEVDSDKLVLKRIIKAALSAMKEADPQSLFLNPVTDAIAPGYSAVIEKPMCIKVMEEKVDASQYISIAEWDRDVQLMFRNCIAYNTGNGGQWFRGEARRQNKIYKEDVLPQSKSLLQKEASKRTQTTDDMSQKRKTAPFDGRSIDSDVSEIEPLPSFKSKRRKKDNQPDVPSIPALSSMVLSDPFVVRLLLDRALRQLRLEVMRGTAIPSAHRAIPSLLQLLHIAQWSPQFCAVRGKRYFVPDAGLQFKEGDQKDGAGAVPFVSLRMCTPVVIQLLLESELDRRTALGGDLNLAAEKLPERSSRTNYDTWSDDPNLHTARALVEGALVHVCRPGNSNEASLATTFPKFATALKKLSKSLWDERPFFVSLIEALLRHKSKLARSTRDVVLASWFEWFPVGGDGAEGGISSALHECLIMLLNEWASLGNLLLPRDMLLKYAGDAVAAADATESSAERKFAKMWMTSGGSESFARVKTQYTRMLESIPEEHALSWKKSVGIVD